MRHPIILISGPTASGKSAVAMDMAERQGGIVINADAMQCYRDLRIITARPTPEEEAHVPHALYGVLDADNQGSAGWWAEQASDAVRTAWKNRQLPILVGGTGMYLKSLMEGLSEIPPVPEEVKMRVRGDNTPLHERLTARDPEMATRLEPGDTQRITRALEVLEATGKSLAWWQAQGKTKRLPEAEFEIHQLELPREKLYTRCDARFVKMMENGALDEVRALMESNPPASRPIMKATGVPELMAHLKGEISLDEAVLKAQQSTRNYAKRQLTWLRHQLKPHKIVSC